MKTCIVIALGSATLSGMAGTAHAQILPQIKAAQASHRAVGIVTNADRAKGVVTLAHEPVRRLAWPAMTMGFLVFGHRCAPAASPHGPATDIAFSVNDKSLFDRLSVGGKVEVEFARQGEEQTITAVKQGAARDGGTL